VQTFRVVHFSFHARRKPSFLARPAQVVANAVCSDCEAMFSGKKEERV